MRTYSDTSPRAYVTDGQRRYTMYTSSPSAMVQPSVPHSPPPWDGSAEGYGPAATDYGVFYKKADGLGCGGCGCGKGLGEATIDTNGLIIGGGFVLGHMLAPTFKVSKTTGTLLGGVLGYVLSRIME